MLGGNALLIGLDHFFRHIGVLEETEPYLDAQDPADCLIDDFHRDFSALHSRLQVILIDMGSHIHVHSRDRRLYAGVCIVCRNTVDHTFLDRVRVADDKTFKSQFPLEDVAQQIFIHCAGHTVKIVESCHRSCGAFLHSRAESRQVDIVQLRRRH